MEAAAGNEVEPLMKWADLAKYLGISVGTLRNRVYTDPTFPREKVWGSVRFRRSRVDAWIEERRGKQEQETTTTS